MSTGSNQQLPEHTWPRRDYLRTTTVRRECLDFMIPLNERYLRRIRQQWVAHYNRGRPHASLGPGLPDRPLDPVAASNDHRLPEGHRVVATPILGGLHHEYGVEPNAA